MPMRDIAKHRRVASKGRPVFGAIRVYQNAGNSRGRRGVGMRRTFCTTVLLVGALLAAGCDNEVDNPTTPTEPAPTVTETFTGTINVNGAMNHNFNVAAAGNVTLTLTEVTPDATVQVGIALGT